MTVKELEAGKKRQKNIYTVRMHIYILGSMLDEKFHLSVTVHAERDFASPQPSVPVGTTALVPPSP